MKKAVMIIAAKDFRDEELFQPKEILEKNGISVVVASTVLDEVKGIMGGKIKPDILVNDIGINDYDAVIFVGGPGASQYWDDAFALKLAKDYFESKKIIAAICIAPVTLAKAGILKGKNATVWTTNVGQVKFAGAEYTGKNVERDGNIITAAGPFAVREFGEVLVKAITGK